MGANKKKKAAATVGAVSLVAALVLTGTYAWNSISQTAKNENVVYSNPGGRLHDDWNAKDAKNGIKRVYVENFTETTYTAAKDGTVQNDSNAAPIYVRVKLQTYMEFGEDAGVTQKETATGSGTYVDMSNTELDGRNVKQLVSGTKIYEPEKWPVYIKGQSSAFQSYFTLDTKTGTKFKYMPTFNKNKESLLADINGTYEGLSTGSTTEPFTDYTDWATYSGTYTPTGGGSAVTGKQQDAYYYLKGGTAVVNPSVNPGDDKEHTINTNEGHQVSETLETSKIITMEDWLAYDGTTSGQEKTGNYWIYDEDGWAYWAQPLAPGTATGPLLTDVKMKSSLGGNCYYAINVTGEFASAGDWGKAGAGTDKELGFYKNGITDNALTLLNTLSQTSSADWVNITATSSDGATANATTNTISVQPGSTVDFTGTVTLMGQTATNQEITWALDGVAAQASSTATLAKSGNGAKLTIPNDLTAQTLKVTATPKANPNAVVTYKVKVAGPDTVTITNTEDRVKPGETLALTATVTKKDASGTPQTYSNQDVMWSVNGYANGATVITPGTSTLKVSADEKLGNTLTITAKSVIDGKVLATKKLRVTKSKLPIETLETIDKVKVTSDGVLEGSTVGFNNSILGNANNTKTIEIDGVSFFVIAKKDGKALLLTEKKHKESVFINTTIDPTIPDTNKNRWKDSTMRAFLNSTNATAYEPIDANGDVDGNRSYTGATAGWLSDKPTLASAALTTELNTLQEFDDDVTDSAKIDTTKDKIFFLSEADVFGSTGNTAEASVPASFYTVRKTDAGVEKGVKLVAPNGTWISENATDTTTSYKWWWLRSPRDDANWLASVNDGGSLGYSWYGNARSGVRPACWISL